jgi:ribose-phosphate pyrophosphokinase
LEQAQLRIFSGSAHPQLATDIADILEVSLGDSQTTYLPDSEIHIKINELVRGKDIFLIQPCSIPVNDNFMELLLYLDGFHRASANSVTVVMPYYPYARQERMAKGRESISARVVANALEMAGADRVVFVDIHARAIQGFFTIPVDPLSAIPLLSQYFDKPEFRDAAIVSPDVGRASMAGKYAEALNLPLVVMQKRRDNQNNVKTTHVVGDILGRRPIVIDDLIAGGSVLKQIDVLYEQGAVGQTFFAITHPVLLPTALENIKNDDRIKKLVVTNTIPVPDDKRSDKIEVLSIAPLLAEVIKRIHECESLSPLLVMS